jgi:hypothetical protein
MGTSGRLERFLREYPGWASFVALAVGDCVLFGWRFDIQFLKSVGPGSAGMNPMTAFALALSGLSLWLLRDGDRDPREPRLGRAFAIAVACIGALRILGHLAGWGQGIDTWVHAEKLELVSGGFRSRMALSTALASILIGTSLALIDVKTRGGRRLSELMACGGVFVSIVAVTGPFAMALPAAAVLVALGFGVLFARPSEGLVAVLTGITPRPSDARAVPRPAGEDLLGFARDEMIGRNDLDYVPRNDADRPKVDDGVTEDASRRPDEVPRRAWIRPRGASS